MNRLIAYVALGSAAGGVARLLFTAFVQERIAGTFPLGTLLVNLTGSFALAGLTVGVDLAASAIAAPVLGRIIDRRGPRAVMLVTGIVCPVALVFILLADRLALSTAALVAAAAIAGAFAPPVTVLTRTVWRYRFDDPAERKTAFALDAVLIELAFTLGPVLVAVLLAVASPRVAFASSRRAEAPNAKPAAATVNAAFQRLRQRRSSGSRRSTNIITRR